jgi:DNA-binding MarR family transcriptional regulator
MVDRKRATRTVIDRSVYVPHYLMITANALASGASRLYRKHFGLGINECRIVAILGHQPDKTALEISAAVAMNKSIVSRSLHTLLKRDFISQAGQARGRRYRLTPLGEELQDKIVRMSMERQELLLAGIDDGQRPVLLALLARMLDNVAEVNRYELTAEKPLVLKSPGTQ